MRRLEYDWQSPSRLATSPIKYEFPGDRFIPNRSLMDIDRAHSLLTKREKEVPKSPHSNEEYQRRLRESLTLDSEGKPFKMLVFRGSPKSNSRSVRLLDEMQRRDAEEAQNRPRTEYRRLPKKESKILDAPGLRDDFYVNIMDWGKNDIIAIALGSSLYLWNSKNSNTKKLFEEVRENCPTSVAWSEDAKAVAIGHMSSKLNVWDAETSKIIRKLGGHRRRVGTVAWNGHILTSGSLDGSIINHDVRAKNSLICRIQAHTLEVCRLKWSSSGSVLASGGNDNHIYIWEASKMSSSFFLQRFTKHKAAVKALAWCPYQSNILASGGGTSDGCVKLWNVQKGTCISSIDAKAQVCGLEWNRHHKEIMSGHGYSLSEQSNRLCLWKYPSMSSGGELMSHSSRILQLSQSPDGLTVAAAGADQTLRFWEVFGPPSKENTRVSELDSFLSLKLSPLR